MIQRSPIGIAIALATIGILAILGQRTVDQPCQRRTRPQTITAKLRWVGSALVLSIGSSLVMLTLMTTVV